MISHLCPVHPVGLALVMVDGLGCLEILGARIPRIITLTTMQAVLIMVAAMAADITAEALMAGVVGIIDLV
jgi:hypothetical protein